MCGIAGAIELKNSINVENFKLMTRVINHRGPDDEGFYFYNNSVEDIAFGEETLDELKNEINRSVDDLKNNDYTLAFGHRRLSILDLSKNGHQPMVYPEVIITFNGEIYNYIEIRNELISKGYEFKTKGDTEVIINAYRHWGEECVKHFNGMWAFVLFDKKENKLFFSRDRLGEKPLYYFVDDRKLIFGSEIKQLLEYGVKPRANDEILTTFLISAIHDVTEETFFKDIFSLQGGHNLSVKIDFENKILALNKYKYWDIKNLSANDNISRNFEESSKYVGELLNESIDLRLRSDVKIGSCLSGGLDSSSVVTLVSEKLGENRSMFNTFTACYDTNKEVDERYYSDLVVENSKCTNVKVKPTSEKLKVDLEKLIWHQEEPFGSLGIFASWCVMESAKEAGVKVLLDGQGGDETLLGYERSYPYLLKAKFVGFKWKELYHEFKCGAENSKLTIDYLIKYSIYFNNRNIRKARLNKKAKRFVNSKYREQYSNLKCAEDLLSFETLKDMQFAELTKNITHLLRYEDRNSMAHSVEARVPFLDPKFVEETFHLDDNLKIKDGWTKALLREFMKDKMPNDVTYRKNKLGFSVPQKAWLDSLNEVIIYEFLEDSKSAKFFNMDFIREIFKNKTYHDIQFKYLVVENWFRIFNVE